MCGSYYLEPMGIVDLVLQKAAAPWRGGPRQGETAKGGGGGEARARVLQARSAAVPNEGAGLTCAE